MWFFVVIFLILGIGLIVAGRYMEQQAARSASWPVTDGKLERCDVVERAGIRSTGDPGTWHLDLAYSYEVNGKSYRSTQYAFGYGDNRDDTRHRAIAAELHRSPQLSVRYNPSRPAEAVLSDEAQPNISWLGYALLGMAAISMLIAMAMR